MPKISRITTQKKRHDRYNIFLDNGYGESYGFSVDENVLVEYRLQKHMELDEATIQTLIQQDTFHKNYALAINYLSYRMRTRKEIYDYLIKKEVDDEQITPIINKLTDEGLIDDEQFAEAFVRTRMNTSDKGPGVVEQELCQKGIHADIAAEAVNVYTFSVQYEKALHLAKKKFSMSGNKSFMQQIQKLQRALMQKGFTSDVVQAVSSEFQEYQDHNMEWEALVKQADKLYQKYQKKYTGPELEQKLKEALYRKGFSLDLISQLLEDYSNNFSNDY